nr:hypothetical protein CFP56_56955 [Quercus suber]
MGDPGVVLDKFTNVSISQADADDLFPPSSREGSTAPTPIAPEPSAEEIAATITTLCNSLKVISAPICPTHPELYMCSCPGAIATHSPSMRSKLKRKTFCRLFDAELLRITPHAFDYDGTQTAHHLFVCRTRTTPKHWLRDWLQTSIAATLFAPQGKLRDTITALLDYWVMRATQWRARYGSHHAAAESPWFETEYAITYPSVKEPAFPTTHALARGTLLAGDECLVLKTTFSLTTGGLAITDPTHSARPAAPASDLLAATATREDLSTSATTTTTAASASASEAHSGDPRAPRAPRTRHETHIEASPMCALARGFGVRYHVWDACHAACAVLSARRQQWLANRVAADLARRLGYADCWAGKGMAQEAVDGPWAKVRT